MWITLFVCFYLSFTCISASSITRSSFCQLQGRFKLKGMHQDGDLIIGGLFAFHLITVFPVLNFKREPEQSHCERFYMASFQQAQTMVYAINEINNNPKLLPNITLGYHLYDNCVKLGLAFRSATALLSGTDEIVSNFNCTGPPPVIGIVGDPGSTHCIAISSVLGLFRIPMVSYYATCSCLSDRKKYPSFFRTIPSDAFQVRAMIQILRHFGWTWVGLLYSDDDYGIYAAQSFQKEVQIFGGCVSFSEILPLDNNHVDIQRIVQGIQASTARVVVVFSTEAYLLPLMDEVVLQNVTGRQWIASEAWATSSVFHTQHLLPFLGGTLGIAIRRGEIQGLQEFLLRLHPDSNLRNNMPQQSVCSESCPPGTRRARRKGLPVCCFDCLPCADGEISNISDSIECTVCPDEFWSNPKKDECVPKEVEFLSYEEPLGISLSTASLLGTCICSAVVVIFAHHRHTPVVRANNSELSFLLLLSLKLCFLCVLLFIGRPQLWTCQLRHAVFGISFVLCISSILVKTMVVIAVFKSSRPEGKGAMKWFGAAQQRCTVLVLTALQVVICSVWLSNASPVPHKNNQYTSSKIVFECTIGSVAGFSMLLGYIGLLAAVSFLLAFLARNLPDNFNEAKFITFSMLIFCAVWIAFVPAFVSSPGKYAVAVEIFAILASSFGLLVAIFAPKCYIIIVHPERNTKKAIMGRTN
ncbi:olfactory receptor CQ1 isoform X1 [Carassius auratus]|uniref:Olfactory receptor CQ1 isoform X1 n=1 Tax=Carassius auratus TaxID=7957 RepID=A0A6P6RDI5_CARAU|nr:extracellular calcium-sensing receptor-like isoform X1 [Carassius auratus]